MKKKILAIGVLGIYSCMFLGCNVDLTKLPTIPFEKFVLEGETEEKDYGDWGDDSDSPERH